MTALEHIDNGVVQPFFTALDTDDTHSRRNAVRRVAPAPAPPPERWTTTRAGTWSGPGRGLRGKQPSFVP